MRANRQMVPMMAILAAGILGAGVALAELPEGQGAAGPEGMHGFGRLHQQLNLNAQQEALWQKAQAAQRDAFKALRAKGEETRTKLRAEIDKPGVDLKEFAQQRDQLREQMRAEAETSRQQVRAAWFSLYDSLDATQREQVRVAIRDGMDRMGHHGMRRGGPREAMHG